MARIKGTLHKDIFTFMTISPGTCLRVKNISVNVVEKIKTQTLFSNLFRKSCRLWDNVKQDRQCRYNVDWGAFTNPLSPWKSNTYYVFLCVCTSERASVLAWLRGRMGMYVNACSLTYPACYALHHMFRQFWAGCYIQKKIYVYVFLRDWF